MNILGFESKNIFFIASLLVTSIIIVKGSFKRKYCRTYAAYTTAENNVERKKVFCGIESKSYMVAIHYETEGNICTGALMSHNLILTSMKCCPREYQGNKYKIFVGKNTIKTDISDSVVQEVLRHPNYDETTNENGVCILKLKSPVLQSERTSFAKVVLPSEWGENTDPICLNGTLITFSKDQLRCQSVYFEKISGSTTFTAVGRNSSNYGSPYICDEFLYGVLMDNQDNRLVFSLVEKEENFIYKSFTEDSVSIYKTSGILQISLFMYYFRIY